MISNYVHSWVWYAEKKYPNHAMEIDLESRKKDTNFNFLYFLLICRQTTF